MLTLVYVSTLCACMLVCGETVSTDTGPLKLIVEHWTHMSRIQTQGKNRQANTHWPGRADVAVAERKE